MSNFVYRLLAEHNVSSLPLDLNNIVPQPGGGFAYPVDRQYGLNGEINDSPLVLCFHWDFVADTDEYLDILEQFGLDENDTSEVTVWARDERMQGMYYEGTALLPEMKTDVKYGNFFPRDVDLYVVDLVEMTS